MPKMRAAHFSENLPVRLAVHGWLVVSGGEDGDRGRTRNTCGRHTESSRLGGGC